MAEQILRTIHEEFSDLPDATALVRVVLRLLLAATLGGILGYEREHRGKSAGMRTHMLVALGAALFVLVPEQAGASSADISRVAQGIVTGIGFLGAGSIVKAGDASHVRGLTTAAGIWLTSAIGIAAGMGRSATAIFCAMLALMILAVLPALPQSPESPVGKRGAGGEE